MVAVLRFSIVTTAYRILENYGSEKFVYSEYNLFTIQTLYQRKNGNRPGWALGHRQFTSFKLLYQFLLHILCIRVFWPPGQAQHWSMYLLQLLRNGTV